MAMCCHQHVIGADTGADLDFLWGSPGMDVPKVSRSAGALLQWYSNGRRCFRYARCHMSGWAGIPVFRRMPAWRELKAP